MRQLINAYREAHNPFNFNKIKGTERASIVNYIKSYIEHNALRDSSEKECDITNVIMSQNILRKCNVNLKCKEVIVSFDIEHSMSHSRYVFSNYNIVKINGCDNLPGNDAGNDGLNEDKIFPTCRHCKVIIKDYGNRIYSYGNGEMNLKKSKHEIEHNELNEAVVRALTQVACVRVNLLYSNTCDMFYKAYMMITSYIVKLVYSSKLRGESDFKLLQKDIVKLILKKYYCDMAKFYKELYLKKSNIDPFNDF